MQARACTVTLTIRWYTWCGISTSMMFIQAGAFSVPVRNFDRCLEFYSVALGIPVAAVLDDKSVAWLRVSLDMDLWLMAEHAFNQELRAGSDAGPVFVVADLEKGVNALGEKGIMPTSGVVEWPDGSRHVTYRDPDGNLLTMYEKGRRSL
jgi:catechol 2,3-dioxygenase-like lactoylglutathione lyase family enzyme